MEGAGPEQLWVQRFQLSRLQAHVAALDLDARRPDRPAPPRLDGRAGPADWLRGPRGAAAPSWPTRPTSGWPRCRRPTAATPAPRIITAAFDEIGEMTAFLEQMPPHRAVRRLELAHEDLDRLGRIVPAMGRRRGHRPRARPPSRLAEAPAVRARTPPDPVIPVDLTDPAGSADDAARRGSRGRSRPCGTRPVGSSAWHAGSAASGRRSC